MGDRDDIGPTVSDLDSGADRDLDCELTATGRSAADDVAEMIEGGTKPTRSLYEQHGFERIGTGESRDAVIPLSEDHITGDCVIKFEREWPAEQNPAEIANWNAAPSEVQEVLAPVVDHGEFKQWLVMPRAEQFGTPVHLVMIEEVLEENGWSCRGLHPENIGLFNGQPKALDYGFPCVVDGRPIQVDD